jgi:glycerol kinase
VPDAAGVRFLPALAGLGAPWWRSEARAVISGVTSGTTRAHIVRAALDSLAFRVRDVVDALPERPDVLRVDGGLTANDYLVQRQADVLGIPVRVAAQAEATALGAAAMALVGAGRIGLDAVAGLAETGHTVEPSPASHGWRDSEYAAWRRFVDDMRALER